MSKFLAGHVTKMLFLKLWITSSWTETFHLNFKEDVDKMMAVILEGKSMPSNMAADTNHTTLLKNQSAIKYLP